MDLVQEIPLSIKFFLNGFPNESKTSYMVYAQLIYKRQKTILSLKMIANINEWDLKNEQYFPTKQFNLVRNNKLREIRENILLAYFDLKKSNTAISVKHIRSKYNGEDINASTLLFTNYYSQYIEELKQRGKEYTDGTVAHYLKTQTHLQKFLKLNDWQNIKLTELSRKFLERFEHYLLTTPNEQTGKPMNGNTATTYIRKIKACVNAALRKDLIQINPLIGFKMKSFKTVNKAFLTIEELDVLKKHNLGDNLSLQKVRDVFIFSCMTGLRHSDMLQLNEKMIKQDKDGLYWISLDQKKTGETVEIPMLNDAVDIYSKYESYRNVNKGKALPVLSNQKTNAALKSITKLTKIDKRLSFHCARHTFGTTTLEQGVDIKTVSALMGHNSIRSTEIYAKLTRKRKGDVIKQLNKINIKEIF